MGNNIKQLEIREIMDHPQNPRKDLGDLAELTESIRIHGIMQNLIVMEKDEMLKGIRAEYEKTPSQIYARTMEAIENKMSAKYVALLGHRRLEAASLADLETVPCIIYKDLTLNEQISLMLLENMQRNNLTIIEEAESFQMMLDLGDTVKTVAEKSGFSQSTVRHRVELAKLDRTILKEKLKEADENGYQLTLTDLTKLEKVDDVAARDRILDIINDGDDIEYYVNEHVRESKERKHHDIIVEKCRKIRGTDLKAEPKGFSAYNGTYDRVLTFDIMEDPTEELEKPETIKKIEKLPEDAILARSYGEFIIAVKSKIGKKLTKQEQERKERERKSKEIRKLTKAMIKGWEAYLMEIVTGSRSVKAKIAADLIEGAFNTIERHRVYVGNHGYMSLAETKDINGWTTDGKEKEKLWEEYQDAPIAVRMLIHLVDNLKTSDLVDFCGKLNKEHADSYKEVLDMIEHIGFRESENNRDLIKGKHELYATKEAK